MNKPGIYSFEDVEASIVGLGSTTDLEGCHVVDSGIVPAKSRTLTVGDREGPVVTIDLDSGTVCYRDGYGLSEAVKVFWDAVARAFPR